MYNGDENKISLYKSNEIQNILGDEGDELVNVKFNLQDKVNLKIFPAYVKIPVNSEKVFNLQFDLGPINVKYEHMSEKGNILTNEKKIEKNLGFDITPPDTKFDLIFDDCIVNNEQKKIFETLGLNAEQHLNNIGVSCNFLIDKIKNAMWMELKNQTSINKIRSNLVAENINLQKKLSKEEIDEKCKAEFKRNSIKSFINPVMNTNNNQIENTFKVERYCYRILSDVETKTKLELWRSQVIKCELVDDERFKFLFEKENTKYEGGGGGETKKFLPKIYSHYPIFEPVNDETIKKHSLYLEEIGKSQTEINVICANLLENKNQNMIQTNLIDFLPYTIGPITNLTYINKDSIKRGDTVIITGRFNVYTAPCYGIRFFFNKIMKLASSKNNFQSQNKSISFNKYCIDVNEKTNNNIINDDYKYNNTYNSEEEEILQSQLNTNSKRNINHVYNSEEEEEEKEEEALIIQRQPNVNSKRKIEDNFDNVDDDNKKPKIVKRSEYQEYHIEDNVYDKK